MCYATGQLGKQCGFVTASGSTELLKTIQLPKIIAVIHQPADPGEKTKEEIGNDLADVAAKATAQQPYKPLTACKTAGLTSSPMV